MSTLLDEQLILALMQDGAYQCILANNLEVAHCQPNESHSSLSCSLWRGSNGTCDERFITNITFSSGFIANYNLVCKFVINRQWKQWWKDVEQHKSQGSCIRCILHSVGWFSLSTPTEAALLRKHNDANLLCQENKMTFSFKPQYVSNTQPESSCVLPSLSQ